MLVPLTLSTSPAHDCSVSAVRFRRCRRVLLDIALFSINSVFPRSQTLGIFAFLERKGYPTPLLCNALVRQKSHIKRVCINALLNSRHLITGKKSSVYVLLSY
jgi:hypothetical protein